MDKREVFLLTRPPSSNRTKLCLLMLQHSEKAVLYLAGDGVYNLLNALSSRELQIRACREDIEARGLDAGCYASATDNFYELLAREMISEGSKVYSF